MLAGGPAELTLTTLEVQYVTFPLTSAPKTTPSFCCFEEYASHQLIKPIALLAFDVVLDRGYSDCEPDTVRALIVAVTGDDTLLPSASFSWATRHSPLVLLLTLHTIAPALAQKGPAPMSTATFAVPGMISNSCDDWATIKSVPAEILKKQLLDGLMNEIPVTVCKHLVDSI